MALGLLYTERHHETLCNFKASKPNVWQLYVLVFLSVPVEEPEFSDGGQAGEEHEDHACDFTVVRPCFLETDSMRVVTGCVIDPAVDGEQYSHCQEGNGWGKTKGSIYIWEFIWLGNTAVIMAIFDTVKFSYSTVFPSNTFDKKCWPH